MPRSCPLAIAFLLVLTAGTAHAQYLFQTDQAGRLMDEILRFLSAP